MILDVLDCSSCKARDKNFVNITNNVAVKLKALLNGESSVAGPTDNSYAVNMYIR